VERSALAQHCPIQPVRMLVDFPAGGILRLSQDRRHRIGEHTRGNTAVVDNKPRVGGNIANV